MFDLRKIVRTNIKNLKPYSSARDEYFGEAKIYLDANENPEGTVNRYPDPYQRKLKAALSNLKRVAEEQIFIGNGSDEAIDLLFRVFCKPGEDQAMTFSPSYGMYSVSAAINDVELITVPLNEQFNIVKEAIEPILKRPQLKLIFICSPNNPTGNIVPISLIEEILQSFQGILVIDEAYIDFSATESLLSLINSYPNLVILQTLSKAYGAAGIRIGMAYAQKEIIELLNRVKPPYNVSSINQDRALDVIKNQLGFKENLTNIILEKERLFKALSDACKIENVFPSEANFLLVKCKGEASELYHQLLKSGIVVRNRSNVIPNALRITVGSKTENDELIKIMNQ